MATRDTIQKAEELKATFESNYPGAQFKVVDTSTERYTEFAVVEIRHCGCGAEVLTHAVGESYTSRCSACKVQAEADREAHHRERQEAQKAQAEWSKFHDEVLNT